MFKSKEKNEVLMIKRDLNFLLNHRDGNAISGFSPGRKTIHKFLLRNTINIILVRWNLNRSGTFPEPL